MRRRRIGGPDGPLAGALRLGALPFGSTVVEKTSFAILDRFVEAGGNLIDTANNYVFWLPGSTGDESETTVGRWMASRGVRDEVLISTKAGARPSVPGTGLETAEGLSAGAILSAAADSLRRLGTDRIDLYWTHIEDRSVPLEETLGTLDELVRGGRAGIIGCSNHTAWRTARARDVSRANGWAAYTCVQQRQSYLQPRFDTALPESGHTHVTPELLDYVRSEPDLTLMAYSSLISGAYTRADKRLPPAYDHPGTPARLAVLREVADELGASPNQVVLSWLMGADPAVLPIVGVSSVEQLDDVLGALEVELPTETRARLDAAGVREPVASRTASDHLLRGNARRSGMPGSMSNSGFQVSCRCHRPYGGGAGAAAVVRTRVADPARASKYPSATSCPYASVTTQREQPRSAASARLGGRALPGAIRPSATAARRARTSRRCRGPAARSPRSRRVPQAGSVGSCAIAADDPDRRPRPGRGCGVPADGTYAPAPPGP